MAFAGENWQRAQDAIVRSDRLFAHEVTIAKTLIDAAFRSRYDPIRIPGTLENSRPQKEQGEC